MTKKVLMVLLVLALVTGATTTAAFARPWEPPAAPEETGTGLLSLNMDINASEVIADYTAAAVADLTGLTVEEIQSRLDAGETISDILLSLGYDPTEIQTLVQDLREQALWAAVEDGVLTAEEVEFLLEHSQAQNQYTYRYSHQNCTTMDNGTMECTPETPQYGSGAGTDDHGRNGRGGGH